jgi:YVTN family beta-propeller protein
VVATVAVGANPVGVAVSPDGTRVYVSNVVSAAVSVIDTTANRPFVIKTLPLGDLTGGAIAVTPDGKKLYAGCHGFAVLDTVTFATLAVRTASDFFEGFVASLDGTRIYGVSRDAGTLVVISTADNTVATVRVPNPRAVAVTPDGQHAYVTNISPNVVSVIETPRNRGAIREVKRVTLSDGGGIAITPDGTQVYVTGFFSGRVFRIATATNTVVPPSIRLGSEAGGIGIIPTPVPPPPGLYAYVTNAETHTVSAIDIDTNKVAATAAVGTNPIGVAVTLDGKHAYVTNNGANTVSVIDTATLRVVKTVPVEAKPTGVAITPDGTHVYVTNTGANSVSVIYTATNTVVATVRRGLGPKPFGSPSPLTANTPMSRITVPTPSR